MHNWPVSVTRSASAAGRGHGWGQPSTGSTEQGWSWPLVAGVRRWWVPPRTTANSSPWLRFTSSTSVAYQPQYAVSARPGSMRNVSSGCACASRARPFPYVTQSKRRSGAA
ncbi:hypothetical protein SAV31267_015540 [Streptomyces avermitilis]|uniref:Uncharacterized protein n=1 Tax=Streptomyces avermitilis TaxID=33903 RepID=A0A4D4MKM5_STRAX|nr:hypothetical protein SAV31267_015540 [Streptomyces avermitilis]